MIFYKGVLISDLGNDYIPGTVTTVFKEALMWQERIMSKKHKGASKHIRHGQSTIIEIEFDETKLLSENHFQEKGIHEHNRISCWLAKDKQKAQINEIVSYRILSDLEINNKFSF